MANQILEQLQVGNYRVNIEHCQTSKGYDVSSIIKQQRQVGIEIASKEAVINELTPEYLTFFCNISGLKGKEIAAYLGLRQGQLSDYKKGTKKLSSLGWSCFRNFFLELFQNDGEVTNPVWLSNKDRSAA